MNIDAWGLSPQDTTRLKAALLDNEEVVLVAKPHFGKRDWFESYMEALPGVLILIFLGYMLNTILTIAGFFLLFMLPFMLPFLVVAGITLTAPWRLQRRKRHTLYLLTNQRVLVIEPVRLFGMRQLAYPLQPNPVRKTTYESDGRGDIIFGYEMRWNFRGRSICKTAEPVGFISVPQAKRIADMIAAQVAATPATQPLPPAIQPPSITPTDSSTYGWGQSVGKNFLLFFGAAFSIFALFFIAIGISTHMDDARFKKEGIATTATVVSVRTEKVYTEAPDHHHDSGVSVRVSTKPARYHYIYYPTFQYTDTTGKVHKVKSKSGSTEYNYPSGHQLDIIYLPDEPRNVHIGKDTPKTGAFLICIGSIGLIIGLGLFAGGLCLKKSPSPHIIK